MFVDKWIAMQIRLIDAACDSVALFTLTDDWYFPENEAEGGSDTNHMDEARYWTVTAIKTAQRTHSCLKAVAAVDSVKDHVAEGRPYGVADHVWKCLRRDFLTALMDEAQEDLAWKAFEPLLRQVRKERQTGRRHSIGEWSALAQSVSQDMADLGRSVRSGGSS